MTDRSFNILHLVSSERWTGVADPVVSLANCQVSCGHNAWVACIGGYTFEEQARIRNAPLITDLTLDRRLRPSNLRADFSRLAQIIDEKQIDIVHTHLLHDNWLAALTLRKKRRPRLLVRTMHRFDWPRRDPLHKWLFTKATDHIVTTSDAMRQRIMSRLNVPADNVDTTFGGVDLDRFSPALDRTKIRHEFNIPDDAPVAGIVARLRDGRGHDWLMRTAPRVVEKMPDAHFLIVGRGELKYPLRAEVAASPIRDNLHMTGFRSDDLPEVYAAMDCAMFLGLGSEGSCRAILEAMACGRPVVGADVGGVGEIIVQDKTGKLVPQGNEQNLADTLIETLSDLKRTHEMGRLSRKRAEERFTEIQRARDVDAIYRKVWRRKFGANFSRARLNA